MIKTDIHTPIKAPIVNCDKISFFKWFLKTYVLVVLLASCITPCKAITIYPSGIKIAIIPSNIIPPPIPSTAEIEEVINAASISMINSIGLI